MEKNNFNKAYICIIAIFAIGLAISNIISFFNGVGFALVGAGVLLMLAIINILKDEEHKKRFGDIFVFIALELLMLVVLFFAYDFNLNGLTNKFPLVMRNICAIYSLLAIGYVIFRYVSEIKGKRYVAIEYLLGNYTPDPNKKKKVKEKVKKNKELENGTLAPKPSTLHTQNEEEIKTEKNDDEVIVEEDEIVENQDNEDVKSENDDTEKTSPVTTNRTNFW